MFVGSFYARSVLHTSADGKRISVRWSWRNISIVDTVDCVRTELIKAFTDRNYTNNSTKVEDETRTRYSFCCSLLNYVVRIHIESQFTADIINNKCSHSQPFKAISWMIQWTLNLSMEATMSQEKENSIRDFV